MHDDVKTVRTKIISSHEFCNLDNESRKVIFDKISIQELCRSYSLIAVICVKSSIDIDVKSL